MKYEARKTGFTIIELLTVMSIIVVIIALLVPSMNAVRRYSKVVRQKGQFHDLGTGLEMFSIDFDGYPDSKGKVNSASPWNVDLDSPTPHSYCGAMRLCEAMMGQDGLGFHPESRFVLSGKDKNGDFLYSPKWIHGDNRRERKHTYIDTDKHRRCPIGELYPAGGRGVWESWISFDPCSAVVISDVFTAVKGQITNEKFGMPILYYKADVTKIEHIVPTPTYHILITDVQKDTYDVRDNDDLTALKSSGAEKDHPLSVGDSGTSESGWDIFYKNTWNRKMTASPRPWNENTFILISAGWDGLYGTRDDVYNFAE